MNIDELLKDSAFKNIDKTQIELVKKMCEELQGKNQTEQMMIFMKYSKSISAGKKISKEEQRLMIKVMLNGLPEQEQAAFKNMLTMVGMM